MSAAVEDGGVGRGMASVGASEPLGFGRGFRLSFMMFFQYSIWGAWLPLLYPFLKEHRGFSASEIASMFAVGAVGSIFGPFIAGQVADRHFSTERFLGVSHLLGGVLVWQLATLESYGAFLVFSLVYSMIYSPTLALTNSLSFHHLPDRDRDFGKVRLWGTVGWIAAGIGIGQWLLRVHTPVDADDAVVRAAQVAGMSDAFRLSAILGLLQGLYCFSLPHTPPARGKERSAWMEALGEVRVQPLLTLFLLAVPVSCIHQFYFVHTATFLGAYQFKLSGWINEVFGVAGGGLMTLGQVSEIFVLAAIPLVAKRVSRRSLLAVGLVAYAARMALFAWVDVIPLPPLVTLVAGILMHGLCFGCFIFVAFMIVDEETTKDVRATAQNLFNLVIVGIGTIAGSYLATGLAEVYTPAGEQIPDYSKLFVIPLAASVACLVLLFVFYPKRSSRA